MAQKRPAGGPPDEPIQPPRPFDERIIKRLVGLMNEHDLSEIDLRDGQARLRLRRGPRRVSPPPAAVVLPPTAPATASAAPSPAPAAKEEPARPARALIEIKSPTPGTFYAKPNPDAEPYVRVGSRVTPSTVVCIIEAMKVMNEIKAEAKGVITQVLVENAKPVEFGQPLFKIRPI